MPSVATLRPAPTISIAAGVRQLDDVHAIEAGEPDLIGPVRNTYELLQRGAQRHPDAPALSFFLRTEDHTTPVVWTHREWMARITQAANAFRQLGVGRDDVIAFILPNLPETHWTIWGGEAAGIVFAINPLLEPALMTELMNAARPKVLVTLAPTPGADIWEKASQAAAHVPSLQHVLTVSPLTYLRHRLAPLLRWVARFKTPRQLAQARVQPLLPLISKAPAQALSFEGPSLDDKASYFCTGGTTGLPKIAVRTHRTEVANALELAATFGSEIEGAGRAVFCGLPLFHVNAQIGTGLTPWSVGAHVVLGTPQGYRAPGLIPRFWDIAAHHRFVFFSGVPTVYSALLQHPPKGQDLSELKYGVCGAAPMPVELFYRFQDETGVKILEGYGLTEGGCVSSINPPHGEARLGSIGLRLPWQDMAAFVLDDQGRWLRDAECDEVGVLAIRGPNLFQGYLNAAHNQGLWIDRPNGRGETERWLNTGDLGRQDADGYFWLTGRKKELIIRGGHNIDPKLIEEALHVHPAVALAAAVGRPDAHAGEVPVVYVQLREGRGATEAELMQHAQTQIAERAAWPKRIQVVETLPTTAIGKIFKPALTLQELASVVREEAQALGTDLLACDAIQDPRMGAVVRWQAADKNDELSARLARYTFKQERLH
ncbi:acyl-CoA synthetase [Aquabacterium sp. NJ1]|uniref:acyl-CoA synthetase n=1 Tax=Aquabacterium sp. NJ1 TaxID=1538295 RepID=UPI00068BE48B|nr:acyl-CoA synthetase [Aquabacterium sp. NJ1]